MKMPSRTPSTIALKLEMWNGLSQLRLTHPRGGDVGEPDLDQRDGGEERQREISAVSSHFCVAALSSMPMTQIHVMTPIHTTPTNVTAQLVSAADCQPKSRNE